MMPPVLSVTYLLMAAERRSGRCWSNQGLLVWAPSEKNERKESLTILMHEILIL